MIFIRLVSGRNTTYKWHGPTAYPLSSQWRARLEPTFFEVTANKKLKFSTSLTDSQVVWANPG